MSKARLVTRLTDELGTSAAKARRFVNDVGPNKAEELLNRASRTSGGSRVSGYWKPAVATGGLATGGALGWRQQEVWKVEAEAEKAATELEALQSIADMDLDPDKRAELAEALANAMAGNNGGGGGDGDGWSWPWGEGALEDAFGGVQTTLVLVVVVAIVLAYTLEDV